jgi:hypothetical protein
MLGIGIGAAIGFFLRATEERKGIPPTRQLYSE